MKYDDNALELKINELSTNIEERMKNKLEIKQFENISHK